MSLRFVLLLVADVTDPGGLVNAIVRKSKTLTRALGTHTLSTVTTVMLERGVDYQRPLQEKEVGGRRRKRKRREGGRGGERERERERERESSP